MLANEHDNNSVMYDERVIPLKAPKVSLKTKGQRNDRLFQHQSSLSVTLSTTASTNTSSSRTSESDYEVDGDDDDSVDGTNARQSRQIPNEENVMFLELFEEANVRQMNERAQNENAKLNLNLGIPVDLTVLTSRSALISAPLSSITDLILRKFARPPIQAFMHLLNCILLFIENPLFHIWSQHIPLRLRQKLTFFAWGLYLPIHKALLGRKTGLHRSVSLEYHALTSVMWWGRLVS